jgi:hypothetical protein
MHADVEQIARTPASGRMAAAAASAAPPIYGAANTFTTRLIDHLTGTRSID